MVIGAMKSGTSTFYSHLASHPQIAASRVKEPEFFSESQGHGVDVGAYEDLWQFDPDVHRFCAEASTGYTKYPLEAHVPDRIREAGLEPRFIYIVRDPIARMESQFNHGHLRRKKWAQENFWSPALLDPSRYYMQMQQYLLRFPDKSRYLIVDFDELATDAQTLMDSTFRWLGLEPIPVAGNRRANSALQRSRAEILLSDLGLTGVAKAIPDSIGRRLKKALREQAPGFRRMTDYERQAITRFLKPDIERFGNEFGFPVEKWGF